MLEIAISSSNCRAGMGLGSLEMPWLVVFIYSGIIRAFIDSKFNHFCKSIRASGVNKTVNRRQVLWKALLFSKWGQEAAIWYPLVRDNRTQEFPQSLHGQEGFATCCSKQLYWFQEWSKFEINNSVMIPEYLNLVNWALYNDPSPVSVA